MDIEDIESTLDSLRKLYRILGKDEDSAIDITSNSLDDKTQLLLKHLLDMETKKVFKAHSEVLVAGQGGTLSGTQYSTQPLQLSYQWKQQLPRALQNHSEISPVIQNSGNDLDNFDYKNAKITNQETPPNHPILGYGIRNKCCRICKRRIAEQSTLCDLKAGSEIISLHQLSNHHIDNFPESSRTLEKEKQKGLEGLNITATGSMQFSLYRRAASTMEATDKCQVVDPSPEEASDVIKQIELAIQNLKIRFGSSSLHTSASCPVDNVAQNELSDRISDFVPKTESEKSPKATGTEWGQIGYSDVESAESFYGMVNDEHKDSSPQQQLPSKTLSQEMKMKLENEDSVQPLKYLPLRNSRESHISSQGEDTLHFGQSVKSIIAKIESLNQARQNDSMPSEAYNFKSPDSYMITERVPVLNRPMQKDLMPKETYNLKNLSPNGYMNSVTIPASVTPNQIDMENLHEKQGVLDGVSRIPGACQPSGPPSIPAEYYFNVNQYQSWKAQRKKNLPFQEFEGHIQLENSRTTQSTVNSKWMDEVQVRNPKKKGRRNPPRKISRHKHEYEDTYLNSSSSSQQGSTSYRESEETYIPDWKYRQKYNSPSPSSRSGLYTLRTTHQWHHHIDTSSSADKYSSSISDRDRDYELTSISCDESTGNYSSSTSATTDRFSSFSGSESKEYSSQPRFRHHKKPRYFQRNLKSEETDSARFCKQHKGMKLKKQVGTWKKLKDKLSVIFHHHHHHHHHHHLDPDEDGRDASNHEARKSRGKSLSKCTAKSSPSVRFEAYGKGAVEKVGKPFGNVVHRRNQGHHFNGLVGGLFRHIRHSNKSEKSAKKLTKQLEKGQYEGKKARRKQEWWQMLQRRRKFKKLGLGYK